MFTKVTLSAALLAAALVGVPPAYAVTNADTTAASPGLPTATAPAPTGAASNARPEMTTHPSAKNAANHLLGFTSFYEREGPRDVSAFASSKVTLEQAIADAQRSTNATAVEAVFRAAPGRSHYLVWLTKVNQLYHATVDAESGDVVSAAHGLALHRLNPSMRADVNAVEQAKASLADAIAIAAKDSNDKPIAADLERSEGMRAYHVALIENGAVQTIWVSPDNPTIIASK